MPLKGELRIAFAGEEGKTFAVKELVGTFTEDHMYSAAVSYAVNKENALMVDANDDDHLMPYQFTETGERAIYSLLPKSAVFGGKLPTGEVQFGAALFEVSADEGSPYQIALFVLKEAENDKLTLAAVKLDGSVNKESWNAALAEYGADVEINDEMVEIASEAKAIIINGEIISVQDFALAEDDVMLVIELPVPAEEAGAENENASAEEPSEVTELDAEDSEQPPAEEEAQSEESETPEGQPEDPKDAEENDDTEEESETTLTDTGNAEEVVTDKTDAEESPEDGDLDTEAATKKNLKGIVVELLQAAEEETQKAVISTSADPANGGTTYVGPQIGERECNIGSEIIVRAYPSDGFAFAGWLEDGLVVSADGDYTFTVESDRNLVASFVELQPHNEQEGQEIYSQTAYLIQYIGPDDQVLKSSSGYLTEQYEGNGIYTTDTISAQIDIAKAVNASAGIQISDQEKPLFDGLIFDSVEIVDGAYSASAKNNTLTVKYDKYTERCVVKIHYVEGEPEEQNYITTYNFKWVSSKNNVAGTSTYIIPDDSGVVVSASDVIVQENGAWFFSPKVTEAYANVVKVTRSSSETGESFQTFETVSSVTIPSEGDYEYGIYDTITYEFMFTQTQNAWNTCYQVEVYNEPDDENPTVVESGVIPSTATSGLILDLSQYYPSENCVVKLEKVTTSGTSTVEDLLNPSGSGMPDTTTLTRSQTMALYKVKIIDMSNEPQKLSDPNPSGIKEYGNDGNIVDYYIRWIDGGGNVVHEEKGSLPSSQTANVTFKASDYLSGTNQYMGTTISAGEQAVSFQETDYDGQITISNDSAIQANVVKATFYAYSAVDETGAKRGSTIDNTDVENKDDAILYDTSRVGVHTEKRIKQTDETGNNFEITLESWNVSQPPSISLVVDASGSMAWPIDRLEPITFTKEELESKGLYVKSPWQPMLGEDVAKILDQTLTDNTKLSHGGYQYYAFDERASVNEYVPIAYMYGLPYGTIPGTEYSTGRYNYSADGTRGWYYVNYTATLSGSVFDDTYLTAKQYCGLSDSIKSGSSLQYIGFPTQAEIENGTKYIGAPTVDRFASAMQSRQGPMVFWIERDSARDIYTLYGAYRESNRIHRTPIFYKPAETRTKSEVLQGAIAGMEAILKKYSPHGNVSIAKFASEEFATSHLDNLIVLDWTNDSKKIVSALNQISNSDEPANSLTIKDTSDDGINEYNYFLTGHTDTKSGLTAAEEILYSQTEAWANNTAMYTIVFTDGKDTGDTTDRAYAINIVSELIKKYGSVYSAYSIMMKSASLEDSDEYGDAKSFLMKLSKGINNDSELDGENYFEADFRDADRVEKAFEQIVLEALGQSKAYSFKDYIDPRFDVYNSDGICITRLDGEGHFPESGVNVDGEYTIYYDDAKGMFYAQWDNVKLPFNEQSATQVATAEKKIKLVVKPDFIGGNHVATNGNEEGQNIVTRPLTDEELKDIFGSVPVEDIPASLKQEAYEFPMTSASTRVLEIDAVNYEDTYFEGESFASYADRIRSKIVGNKNLYVEYLSRYDQFYDENAYERFNAFETVVVPYYYLPGDLNVGTEAHMGDRIGLLKYEWSVVDEEDSAASFLNKDVANGMVKLKVTYIPDSDEVRGGQTEALYGDESFQRYFKENVGEEKTQRAFEGLFTAHVVNGKINVKKEMGQDDIGFLFEQIGADGEQSLIFKIYKDETAYKTVNVHFVGYNYSRPDDTDEDIYITANDVSDNVLFVYSLDGLPLGNYTVWEDGSSQSMKFEEINYEDPTTAKHSISGDKVSFKIGIEPESSDYPHNETTVDQELANEGLKDYLVADEGSAVIRNAVSREVNVIVSKQVQGNGDRYEKFDFSISVFAEDDEPYTETIREPSGAINWEDHGNGVYSFQLGHDDSITIPLPVGVTYVITENPDGYNSHISIRQGENSIRNLAEAPSAKGIVTANGDDIEVDYINSLFIIVPAGITASLSGGIVLIAIGIIASIGAVRKKRKA